MLVFLCPVYTCHITVEKLAPVYYRISPVYYRIIQPALYTSVNSQISQSCLQYPARYLVDWMQNKSRPIKLPSL